MKRMLPIDVWVLLDRKRSDFISILKTGSLLSHVELQARLLSDVGHLLRELKTASSFEGETVTIPREAWDNAWEQAKVDRL